MSNGREDPVDVLVVGGGIHGVGVLQAAAAGGWSALMVEERAPAAATSSRSSKLIHGGLRYLETMQLGLVRESLRERATLLRIAPHLVRLVPFHIPVYASTSRSPWKIRAGLALYALLGGMGQENRFERVRRRDWGQLDGLDTYDLRAIFRYRDGQTDDAALTQAVLASAMELGARAEWPARFCGARRVEDGYVARIELAGAEYEVHCGALVNAAGPWVVEVQQRITPRPRTLEVDLVAGTHIELPTSLERGIYYCEAPQDGRAVFVMPWRDRLLVGTTETLFEGDPAEVAPLASETSYLVATLEHYFPGRSGSPIAAWAGLRVLPRSDSSPFHRRRDVTLTRDDDAKPRLVAIYGGKLTGYRATAEKVLRTLAAALPARRRRADTTTLVLPEVPAAE